MSATAGIATSYGIRSGYGIATNYGVRSSYGIGTDAGVTVVFSTLVGSSGSFAASGGSITITFTARDSENNPVVGYTPTVEAGVV